MPFVKAFLMRNPRFFLFILILFSGLGSRAQTAPDKSTQPDTGGARASSGGVEILSDTQGVDFKPWLAKWNQKTKQSWDRLIPDGVNPPKHESGTVAIRFKVLPNGRLMSGGMVLEGPSGYVGLDRAAWALSPAPTTLRFPRTLRAHTWNCAPSFFTT